jgi:hypothetical protein
VGKKSHERQVSLSVITDKIRLGLYFFLLFVFGLMNFVWMKYPNVVDLLNCKVDKLLGNSRRYFHFLGGLEQGDSQFFNFAIILP